MGPPSGKFIDRGTAKQHNPSARKKRIRTTKKNPPTQHTKKPNKLRALEATPTRRGFETAIAEMTGGGSGTTKKCGREAETDRSLQPQDAGSAVNNP